MNIQVATPQECPGKTQSRTVTDIITGEHEHTILGYTLLKGIGDGEPVASDRFTVGGHEWVLLFYPDGKRSSSETHVAPGGLGAGNGQLAQNADGGNFLQHALLQVADVGNQPGVQNQGVPVQQGIAPVVNQQQHAQQQRQRRERDISYSDYTALFVALIGESKDPQGIVNANDGKVVRAFHQFMLVDQSGHENHLLKGRSREDGAVKISCARTDPNARNCHGYRKFVRRSILEDPEKGFLVNDTIIIRYKIDLVVSQGGCLNSRKEKESVQIVLPPPTLGQDLLQQYLSGVETDVSFILKTRQARKQKMVPEIQELNIDDDDDDEAMQSEVESGGQVEVRCHRNIVQARSPVFNAMLNAPMKEAEEGVVYIDDIDPEVFKALMHYIYSDYLPPALTEKNLQVAMAQHLLIAADRFQISRLRVICEKRLCDTLTIDTVAHTVLLAEQNNAEKLKRVCLDFIAKHLHAVMRTEGWKYVESSYPGLVNQTLTMVAQNSHESGQNRQRVRAREDNEYEDMRRVRPRIRDAQ